jgi:DNA (cytosine-5)-methyltransferase 1
MSAYYNENNPQAAAMLRQLIADGVIAAGVVDERSIAEVTASDLKGFAQHHFFAGIGGWSIALRLAGWPDDKQVWTGSCPCQPFSTAGKQKGKTDDRHLWPIWFRLIQEYRPSIVFGEQVASSIAHGWWDEVATDLEAEGYACGAAVLPACSVGAPHKRDRLWFVGYAEHNGRDGIAFNGSDGAAVCDHKEGAHGASKPAGTGCASYVADPQRQQDDQEQQRPAAHEGRRGTDMFGGCGVDSEQSYVADPDLKGWEGHGRPKQQHGAQRRQEQDGHFSAADLRWITCPDGKARSVGVRFCSLAYGVQRATVGVYEESDGILQT